MFVWSTNMVLLSGYFLLYKTSLMIVDIVLFDKLQEWLDKKTKYELMKYPFYFLCTTVTLCHLCVKKRFKILFFQGSGNFSNSHDWQASWFWFLFSCFSSEFYTSLVYIFSLLTISFKILFPRVGTFTLRMTKRLVPKHWFSSGSTLY